jgi:hypothetical protein
MHLLGGCLGGIGGIDLNSTTAYRATMYIQHLRLLQFTELMHADRMTRAAVRQHMRGCKRAGV